MEDQIDEPPVLAALATVGKAFAHANRLQLLGVLAQGERSVEVLARTVGLGVTTASAHLQILKAAGLVETRRAGTHVVYRLAGDDVADLLVRFRAVGLRRSARVERCVSESKARHGADAVREITRDELAERMVHGDVAVVDVRPAEEYAAGHLPGAVSIPLAELPARLHELSRDHEVIAYCRGAHCVMGYDAVRLIEAAGFTARRLEDGLVEWRLAGRPLEAAA